MRGAFFGPHLVKVRDETKSSDEGQSKSFVLGLDECFCIIGPHLVEVQDETKSSNEGHISDTFG